MELTVGVDLGKFKSQFAVLGEDGKVIVERKLPNQREVVQHFLRGLPGKVARLGCETCLNCYWLVEVVEEIGLPIQVGHALNLRLIAQSRVKTDRIDARVIAELLRAGFFPAITIPPREIRQLRELLRGRIRLSRSAVQARNRIHGLLTRAGVDYDAAELHGSGAEAFLQGLDLSGPERFMAEAYLRTLRAFEQEVKTAEKELVRLVKPAPEWQRLLELLQSIPGVGLFSALVFLLELWDISRFPGEKQLASYVGLVPGVRQTGQTLRGGKLTKQGNVYLRWLLVQDAWVAARNSPRYRGMHEHYARKHGRTRGIIPVARQLLFDVYAVWREGISYEELLVRKQRRRSA